MYLSVSINRFFFELMKTIINTFFEQLQLGYSYI